MTNQANETVSSNRSNLVKVRVKNGRLLIGREGDNAIFAEEGDVVEVDRKWATALLKRKLEGYPPTKIGQYAGEHPGMIIDCPIELISE